MSSHSKPIPDIASLASVLRSQLSDSSPGAARNRRKGGNNTHSQSDSGLQENLATLLDLLDDATSRSSSDPDAAATPAASPRPTVSNPTAEELLETLDRSLAAWQAEVTLAYSQTAVRDLADLLQRVELLSQGQQQKERHLEDQRFKLQQETASLLQTQARTARQRKAIAQTLRAQKAEMLRELDQRHQKLEQRNDELEQQHQELQQRNDELEQQHQELQQRNVELEQQHQELEQLRLAAEAAQLLAAESIEHNCDDPPVTQALRTELDEARAELTMLYEELKTHQLSREKCQADLQFLQNQWAEAESAQHEFREQEETVRELQDRLRETQQQLQELQQRDAGDDSEQSERVTHLESRLQLAEQERQDLLQQNSDLAAQIARHQVISSGHTPHVSFDQQSLSWEERKKLIMLQLEDETDDAEVDSEEQTSRRLEVEDVLSVTQGEIERRDQEIAELQAIIEQQSDTRQGLAIGAAAFAQAFDSDEIIQQERQKLKEIQREWEEKLRQAEIDVSLERAKLARERTQLEQELANITRELPTNQEPSGQTKKRKWLEHLGLRDETRGAN